MERMRKPYYLIYALPWLVAIFVVGWILIQRFPPSGVFVVSSSLDGRSPFVNTFLPSERVSKVDEGQRIIGDPVYLTARIPGPYERVEVEVEFRPIQQTLLEFGMVKDEAGKELDLQPMYSSELDRPEWRAVAGGFVTSGTSAGRLLSSELRGLATWDATATMPLLMDSAHPREQTETSLRGSHDFYFLPSGSSLDVDFGFQDANRARDKGVVVFRVFRGDEELQRFALDAGGSREMRMGKVMTHRVTVPSARPGVYRIAFQADDDIFIRSIETPSQHWVIGPRLNFGDVVGFATGTFPGRAWTNSRHLIAETFHAEGLQKIVFGPRSASIIHTHEAIRLDRRDEQASPIELSIPKGDVRLVGDGWFAIRPNFFFEPKPSRFTDGMLTQTEHIVGVITPYQKPESLGDGWRRASYSFNLRPAETQLRFILSAPGIASRVAAVDIRKITLRYIRPMASWHDWVLTLRHELGNAWRRL